MSARTETLSDTGQAKRDILLKVDEIGWLSVNIIGSHANVEVKEKIEKPELEDNPSPCNIKASADGVITKITAGEGMSQVKKGSGVAKGDLLISGVSTHSAKHRALCPRQRRGIGGCYFRKMN